jgi:hypothetical protein
LLYGATTARLLMFTALTPPTTTPRLPAATKRAAEGTAASDTKRATARAIMETVERRRVKEKLAAVIMIAALAGSDDALWREECARGDTCW